MRFHVILVTCLATLCSTEDSTMSLSTEYARDEVGNTSAGNNKDDALSFTIGPQVGELIGQVPKGALRNHYSALQQLYEHKRLYMVNTSARLRNLASAVENRDDSAADFAMSILSDVDGHNAFIAPMEEMVNDTSAQWESAVLSASLPFMTMYESYVNRAIEHAKSSQPIPGICSVTAAILLLEELSNKWIAGVEAELRMEPLSTFRSVVSERDDELTRLLTYRLNRLEADLMGMARDQDHKNRQSLGREIRQVAMRMEHIANEWLTPAGGEAIDWNLHTVMSLAERVHMGMLKSHSMAIMEHKDDIDLSLAHATGHAVKAFMSQLANSTHRLSYGTVLQQLDEYTHQNGVTINESGRRSIAALEAAVSHGESSELESFDRTDSRSGPLRRWPTAQVTSDMASAEAQFEHSEKFRNVLRQLGEAVDARNIAQLVKRRFQHKDESDTEPLISTDSLQQSDPDVNVELRQQYDEFKESLSSNMHASMESAVDGEHIDVNLKVTPRSADDHFGTGEQHELVIEVTSCPAEPGIASSVRLDSASHYPCAAGHTAVQGSRAAKDTVCQSQRQTFALPSGFFTNKRFWKTAGTAVAAGALIYLAQRAVGTAQNQIAELAKAHGIIGAYRI